MYLCETNTVGLVTEDHKPRESHRPAVTKRLGALVGQAATEALSVIKNKS